MVYFFLSITVLTVLWFNWERRQRMTHSMVGGLHADISLPHEQEWELYHNDLSLCSKKVRVCLAELDIPYKAHHIDLIETGSYETVSRHYLKVNPAGILPALVHNGHPVYESHDIICYAAERAADPTKSLVPADSEQQAVMEQWKDLASIKGDNPVEDLKASAAACVSVLTVPLFSAGIAFIPYHRIVEGLLFHRLKSRPTLFLTLKLVGLGQLFKMKKVNRKLEEAKVALADHLHALDHLLADGRPWITGKQFTLADISWMVLFRSPAGS